MEMSQAGLCLTAPRSPTHARREFVESHSNGLRVNIIQRVHGDRDRGVQEAFGGLDHPQLIGEMVKSVWTTQFGSLGHGRICLN